MQNNKTILDFIEKFRTLTEEYITNRGIVSLSFIIECSKPIEKIELNSNNEIVKKKQSNNIDPTKDILGPMLIIKYINGYVSHVTDINEMFNLLGLDDESSDNRF